MASGGSNGELTAIARLNVLNAWRYVVKYIVQHKTLANSEPCLGGTTWPLPEAPHHRGARMCVQ